MDHIAQTIGYRVLILNRPGKSSEVELTIGSIGPIRKAIHRKEIHVAQSSQMSYIGLSI